MENLLFKFPRYPYFGPNIGTSNVKFDGDEKFVDFGSTFDINYKPFKDASLWDSLFPRKK